LHREGHSRSFHVEYLCRSGENRAGEEL
jgi:hypothetical protein